MGRVEIDLSVDRNDFGPREVFVFLEIAFVVGLNVPARLGIEIFVEDMCVVVVPGSASDSGKQAQRSGRNETRHTGSRKAETCRAAVIGATASQSNRNHSHECRNGKPVGDRPEDSRNKMSVTVHIAVGVWRSVAEQIEGVFPAEA